jgi:hypothetical protein
MKYRLSGLLAAVVMFIGCKDSETTPVDTYGYMPLEVGRYVTYDYKEEIYSAGKNAPVISSWQEKDQVIEQSRQDENSSTFIVARYKRSSDTDYWTKIKEYAVKQTPDKILTTIDNQTVFSLVFPIDEKVRWNGNSFNSGDPEEYSYESVNEPSTVSEKLFDQTITVVERMDSSVINKYTGLKKYALGIGLVYDDQVSFEYCQTQECLNSDVRKVESGFRRTRKVRESGIVK